MVTIKSYDPSKALTILFLGTNRVVEVCTHRKGCPILNNRGARLSTKTHVCCERPSVLEVCEAFPMGSDLGHKSGGNAARTGNSTDFGE